MKPSGGGEMGFLTQKARAEERSFGLSGPTEAESTHHSPSWVVQDTDPDVETECLTKILKDP